MFFFLIFLQNLSIIGRLLAYWLNIQGFLQINLDSALEFTPHCDAGRE